MEHDVDGDTNCNWSNRNNSQKLNKAEGKIGNRRTSGDPHIVKIGQNTVKSSGDLWRLSLEFE